MPVYDFKCECGKTNTLTVGFKEIDGFQCRCECGKLMTRQYGVGAVTFKGSGWGKDKN
jgi:putative FmdB family regulatory protein